MIAVMTILDKKSKKLIYHGLVQPDHIGNVEIPKNIILDAVS